MFQKLRVFFKRHLRIAATILVVVFAVPLVMLFTQTPDGGRGGSVSFYPNFSINGRTIKNEEKTAATQTAKLRRAFDPQSQFTQVPETNYVVRLALLEEAKKLKIEPSLEQLQQYYSTKELLRELLADLLDQVKANNPGASDAILDQQYQEGINAVLRQYSRQFGDGTVLTREDLERYVREEVTFHHLRRIITASVKVTPQQARHSYEIHNEKQVVDYVEFSAADFADKIKVDEEEMKKAYEANKSQFEIGERQKVLFVKFPADDFKELTRVADEDIQRYYDSRRNEFRNAKGELEPLSMHRNKIREMLTHDASMNLAREQAESFRAKLYDAFVAMQLSDAELQSNLESHTEDFADAEGKLADFATLKSKPELAPVLKKLRARTGIEKTIITQAGVLGRKVETTDYFTQTGDIPKLIVGRDFQKKAFALSEEEPFSAVAFDEDGVYVMGFVSSKPRELQPFEKVQDDIRKQFVQTKSLDAARDATDAKLRELREKMAGGLTFAKAAEALQLKVISPEPFTNTQASRGLVKDLPPERTLTYYLAELNPGEITQPLVMPASVGLFHLRERQPADKAEFEKVKNEFTQLLQEEWGNALYNDWIRTKVIPSVVSKEPKR